MPPLAGSSAVEHVLTIASSLETTVTVTDTTTGIASAYNAIKEEENNVQLSPSSPTRSGVGSPDSKKFKKKKKRRRGTNCKSVTFQKSETIIEMPYQSELVEDVNCLWYTDEDYDRIKDDWTGTIKKYANGEDLLEEEGHCLRGLEAKTKFGLRRRKTNRAAALNSVWDEQVSQWKRKMDNQMAIANAYRPHSLHAKYPAIEAAYRDELYVKNNVR